MSISVSSHSSSSLCFSSCFRNRVDSDSSVSPYVHIPRALLLQKLFLHASLSFLQTIKNQQHTQPITTYPAFLRLTSSGEANLTLSVTLTTSFTRFEESKSNNLRICNPEVVSASITAGVIC